MSRRSDRQRAVGAGVSEHADGLVRLECPAGHTVGYLYQAGAAGPVTLLDEHRSAGRSLKGAFQPVRLKCYPCFRSSGAQMDLRLSQVRAEQLVKDVLDDPDRRVHTHVLGG